LTFGLGVLASATDTSVWVGRFSFQIVVFNVFEGVVHESSVATKVTI